MRLQPVVLAVLVGVGNPMARRRGCGRPGAALSPAVCLGLLLAGLATARAESLIAFTAPDTSASGICVVSSSGGQPWVLTPGGNGDRQPTWSGDGGRIGFVSDREGIGGIWVMNADGSAATRLAGGGPGTAFSHPAWDPNSDRIAFQSEPALARDRPKIWLVRSDGSDLHEEWAMSGGYLAVIQPAWDDAELRAIHPVEPFYFDQVDYRSAVVSYSFSDMVGIHQLPLAIRHLAPLGPVGDNGRFACDADGDIWVDANTNLTHSPEIVETDPCWSPDGTRIAFAREGWVWTMAVDGSDARRLVAGTDPAWSPALTTTALLPVTWGQVKAGH